MHIMQVRRDGAASLGIYIVRPSEEHSGVFMDLRTYSLHRDGVVHFYTYYTASKNGLDRAFSTYEGEVHTGCWWGNLRERDNLEDPDMMGG